MSLFYTASKTSGRVNTSGSAPQGINAGVGYRSDGSVCTADLGTVDAIIGGIGVSSAGVVATTTSTTGTDTYIQGVRVSAAGRVVVESAAPVGVVNGNPITASGALAITP